MCVCVCVCVCVMDKQKVLSDLYIFLNRKKLPLETCLKIRFCTSVRTSICSSVLTTGSSIMTRQQSQLIGVKVKEMEKEERCR